MNGCNSWLRFVDGRQNRALGAHRPQLRDSGRCCTMHFPRQAARRFLTHPVEVTNCIIRTRPMPHRETPPRTARSIAGARKDLPDQPRMPQTASCGRPRRRRRRSSGALGAVAGLLRIRVLSAQRGDRQIGTTSLDRTSFVTGVLLAVRKVADHSGLTVGIEYLLNLQ